MNEQALAEEEALAVSEDEPQDRKAKHSSKPEVEPRPGSVAALRSVLKGNTNSPNARL